MGECIHGLEDGLCDTCFPKAPPVAAPSTGGRSTRTPGRRAIPASTRARAKPASGARGGATSVRTLDIDEQRIYHLTHIDNLPGIVERGAVLADASDLWGSLSRPEVDIASAANRQARRAMLVAGESEPPVAGYVPFFLSPNAGVWESIRSESPDPRLAASASAYGAYDFVMLVSTVKVALGAGGGGASVIVANGDATATFTRFATSGEASERMLRTLRVEEESDAILAAEFLVRDTFPIEHVSLIGVANDKVRQSVRQIVASSGTGHRPKVAVYPPWFQPAAEVSAP